MAIAENEKNKSLCLHLLHADSEEDVIEILRKAGYWDNSNLWRLYGDKEGNFAQIGNQSSFSEAAIVEKIVNSIDARLMCECKSKGIDPESESAPKSLRDAIAQFYEGKKADDDTAGTIANWPKAKRTEESRYITLAATGGRPTRGHKSKNMCLTITDRGEGQSAFRLPRTILSLNDKNKQRIRFVQGKFNMGGSGALRFCGKYGLQLIISKRHPTLANTERASDASVEDWAFTIVRREEPSNESGTPIHSEFTYLAPFNAEKLPRKGDILKFKSETMKLMPHQDKPYAKEIEWATSIKLYEYETSVGQSNILMKDGLLFALERLMPETPLPIRLHECRGYGGSEERSFETTIAGLMVRLEDGKGDNLEDGFPLSVQIRAAGLSMSARIYAFKENKASTYLKDEGVIFTINGQSHGSLPKSIFGRKAVALPRLKDSLLVIINCSSLSATQREDLFMTSRDRLSKKPIRYDVESEIQEMLRDNPELKKLQQLRRDQDVESRLSEERPLEEVLNKVLKASPTLKTLFLRGQRLARPFAKSAGGKNGINEGSDHGDRPFKGKKHPTFFKIKGINYGEIYRRNCEIDRRCRIKFETDVENEYFERPTDQGKFELEIIESSTFISLPSYSLVLEEGEAFLNMSLPKESGVNDWITLQTSVTDPILQEPFINIIRLNILEKQKHPSGTSKPKNRHMGSGDGDSPATQGIKLPRVEPVYQDDQHWITHNFDEDTACHVISDPIEIEGKKTYEHVFYINMDNKSLKTEMKYSKQDPRLLDAKFKYGNVLLGLALLHKNGDMNDIDEDSEKNGETIQDRILEFSRAVSPVLLPMIDQLAGLSEEDLETFSVIGEDT